MLRTGNITVNACHSASSAEEIRNLRKDLNDERSAIMKECEALQLVIQAKRAQAAVLDRRIRQLPGSEVPLR